MNHGIRKYLRQYSPNINPEVVIRAGATHMRQAVSTEDLPGVLQAYNHAITQTFYIAAAASAAATLAAFGMGWVNVKKLKTEKAKKTDVSSGSERQTP